MCGRFGLFSELDGLAEQFNFAPTVVRDIYQPRWNIPPTTGILTVQSNTVQNRDDPDDPNARIPRILRWGMLAARRSPAPGRRSEPAPVQRPRRNHPPTPHLQRCLRPSPLPGASQRLLRVAQRPVRQPGSDVVSPTGWRTGSLRRHLVNLPNPGRAHGRLRNHHLRRQRIGR